MNALFLLRMSEYCFFLPVLLPLPSLFCFPPLPGAPLLPVPPSYPLLASRLMLCQHYCFFYCPCFHPTLPFQVFPLQLRCIFFLPFCFLGKLCSRNHHARDMGWDQDDIGGTKKGHTCLRSIYVTRSKAAAGWSAAAQGGLHLLTRYLRSR